jgi:hypothetical protein
MLPIGQQQQNWFASRSVHTVFSTTSLTQPHYAKTAEIAIMNMTQIVRGHTMQTILRYDEIQQRYNGEWVLIVNPVLDQNLEVIQGEVWAHFPTAEETYRAMSLAKGHEVSIEYVGDLPEDFVAIL